MSNQNNQSNQSNRAGFVMLGAVIGGAAMALFNYFRESSQEQEREQMQRNYPAAFRQNVPPEPSNICVVCLEQLTAPIELLPCGHLYHADCLRKCFLVDLRCPNCRYKLVGDVADKYRARLNF